MKFLNNLWDTATTLFAAVLVVLIAAFAFVAVTVSMFVIFVVGSFAIMVAEIQRIWWYS